MWCVCVMGESPVFGAPPPEILPLLHSAVELYQVGSYAVYHGTGAHQAIWIKCGGQQRQPEVYDKTDGRFPRLIRHLRDGQR